MLAFINARVIDCTGQSSIENAAILIEEKFIVSVGKALAIPENATVIDLRGKTIMPAFSDAHTHFGGSDLLSRAALGGRDITYDYALNSSVNIGYGVTTVRTAGDFMPDIVSYRDDVNEKSLRAPRIFTAGRMFVAPGGHPIDTVYQSNPDINKNACIVCDDESKIEEQVKELVNAGANWIKAFISTINKMNYPHPVPRLSHEALQKISDAALKYGKPLMVHVENPKDMEEATDIGANSIEHVIGVGNTKFEISDKLINKLLKNKIFVVPTMSSIKAHDGSLPGAVPVYPELLKAVAKLAKSGVKLAIGCDSGVPFLPYGDCVHTEMELFVQAGITPMDVLCTATKGNAELFGIAHKLGTLEPGKFADLIVLEADPLADIRNTRSICMVLKEGRILVDKMLSK